MPQNIDDLIRGLATEDGQLKVLTEKTKVSAATVTTTASVTNAGLLLVAANPNRRGFIIWNNSANSAYVTLGPVSVSSTPTFIVPTFQSLIWMYAVSWTGPISAIRNGAGTGTMTVYEF